MKIKHIILGLIFTVIAPVNASAGLRLSLPTTYTSHAVGGWDFTNKAALTGYSVDVLWLKKPEKQSPLFYLSVHHVYRIQHKAVGALGGSLGMNTGQAFLQAYSLVSKKAPKFAENKVLKALGNYTSIEYSGGRYFFGPAPESRWYHAVMGKVKVPFDKLFGGN